MWLDLNGNHASAGTPDHDLPCAFLVAYLSRFMTLNPGDLITTGTPPGVGMGMKPPSFSSPEMW